MTIIKSDAHGMYVRVNGAVYRPVPSVQSYPWPELTNGASRHKVGEEVKVRHLVGHPFCRVTDPHVKAITEVWHNHGSYVLPNRKSYECWMPKEC